jgi:vacuolar-type H+-ATPase subunit H
MSEDPFSDVPAPVLIDDPEPQTWEDRPPSDEHLCESCNDPIIRDPGAKGRWPKYHPDCRPSKKTASKSATSARTKAEREADEILKVFTAGAARSALLVSMIDPYDGMVVMIGTKEIGKNLRGLLIRHDSWRRELLSASESGSVIGLVVAVMLTVLPILAHHKILPNEKLRAILEQTPQALVKLNDRLDKGADELAEQLSKMHEDRQKERAEKVSQNGTGNVHRLRDVNDN